MNFCGFFYTKAFYSGFSQTDKIGNIGIFANFAFLYFFHFPS